MKVYRPSDSTKYYMNFVFRGQRVHRSTRTTDKRTAMKIAENTLRQMEDHALHGRPIEMTLGQAVKRYISDHAAPGRKQNLEITWELKMAQFDRLLDYFGVDTPLSAITKERIAKLKSDRFAAGNSRSTVNKYIGPLGAVLNMACNEWGALMMVPKIKREKEDKSRVRWLEDDEERRLYAACENQEIKDLIMFLQDTGARRADALQLERKDVHWDANMVRFDKTKTDLPRSIPMTNRVREIVTRRLANPKVTKVFPWDPNTGKRTDQPPNVRAKPRRNRDGSLLGIYPKGPSFEAKIRVAGELIYLGLFRTRAEAEAAREAAEKKHFPHTANADVNQAFCETVKRAAITDFRMHDLRHDFATRLVRANRRLEEVRDLLGHADLTMTERYAHLRPDIYKEAIAALNRPASTSPQAEGSVSAFSSVDAVGPK